MPAVCVCVCVANSFFSRGGFRFVHALEQTTSSRVAAVSSRNGTNEEARHFHPTPSAVNLALRGTRLESEMLQLE